MHFTWKTEKHIYTNVYLKLAHGEIYAFYGGYQIKQDTATLVMDEEEFEFALGHCEGIYTMIKAASLDMHITGCK